MDYLCQNQPPQQSDNHPSQEIPAVDPLEELRKEMEIYFERLKQQREQEALLEAQRKQELREQELASQREQELLAQKQTAQEEEELSLNVLCRQHIEETRGNNVCDEEKQRMEDFMVEFLEDCEQKMIFRAHKDVDDLIAQTLESKLLFLNAKSHRFDPKKQKENNFVQKQEEVKIITKPEAKNHTRKFRIDPTLSNFKVSTKHSLYPPSSDFEITPVTPIVETTNSLGMGDTHLDTEKDSNKSSVKDPIPIQSESDDISDVECDLPVNDELSPISTTFSNPLFDSNDDFTSSDDKSLSDEDVPIENFKIYSNPLFDDEEIIPTKIDPHSFNAEYNLIESLLNRDILIDSSPKFDYLLEEFSDELAHIDPIPPGIEKADFDLEEEIRLVENLLYDNSSLRPPEELNLEIVDTIFESLSLSPILVEDSDSLMEEIGLFLASDDSMPSGIEDDDYDSEGDIRFLEELLNNDSLLLPENESSNLDHFNDPSPSRPPPKPPDVEIFFDFKPDMGVVTNKVVGDISEHDVLMPNLLPTQPTLCLVFDLLLPFSSKNEDKVFNPGILISPLLSHRGEITSNFYKSPMMTSGGDIPYLDVPFLHFYPP
ncbi:hypothetical protein Tco_1026186 [Tanacetum coccineum]